MELLITMSIIVIVMAILIPIIFGYHRDQSRLITCKNNLRQIGFTHMMYVDAYKTFPLWPFRPTATDILQFDLPTKTWICPADPNKQTVHMSYRYYPGTKIVGGEGWMPDKGEAKRMIFVYENKRFNSLFYENANFHPSAKNGSNNYGLTNGALSVDNTGNVSWLDSRVFYGN